MSDLGSFGDTCQTTLRNDMRGLISLIVDKRYYSILSLARDFFQQPVVANSAEKACETRRIKNNLESLKVEINRMNTPFYDDESEFLGI